MSHAAAIWVNTFDVTLVAATAFAAWKGGGPERVLASAFVLARLLTETAYAVDALTRTVRFVAFLPKVAFVDLGLLIVLWLVALYANRWWPMVVCATQAISSIGHVMRWLDPTLPRAAYERMTAFSGWPAIFLLVGGTIAHVIRAKRHADPSWSASLPWRVQAILSRLRMG